MVRAPLSSGSSRSGTLAHEVAVSDVPQGSLPASHWIARDQGTGSAIWINCGHPGVLVVRVVDDAPGSP